MTKASFGKGFRKEFSLEPEYVPLNHGSYGVQPHAVRKLYYQFQEEAEKHPDRWNRFEIHRLIRESRESIGKLIKCDTDDVVFVQNASQASNTILRSFPFKEGDKILYYHTLYATLDQTLSFLRDQYKVQLVCIDLKYPLEDADVIEITKEKIRQEHAKEGEPKIRMAIIDLLSSLPAVRMPYKELTKTVQEQGILAMVDGAHSVGQVELDMQELDPDFFFSNCHKWLYAPRGCALLYVPKRNQGFVHPTTINSTYQYHEDPADHSTFLQELKPPTVDTSPYMCVKAAIEYRESIGGEAAINAYCHDIAVRGGDLVAKKLGTSVMENSTKTLTANMVNIELPHFKTSKSDSEVQAFFMQKSIYEHHTTLPVYKNNNKWWVRLCGQIYVDLDDFDYVANVLRTLVDEINEN
ncbi:pyridoxal phosphate-dependent transferase [Blakeslea trispora]|nr:pyridoxal phosphate-dependent transferase [Blakeslea trispora]